MLHDKWWSSMIWMTILLCDILKVLTFKCAQPYLNVSTWSLLYLSKIDWILYTCKVITDYSSLFVHFYFTLTFEFIFSSSSYVNNYRNSIFTQSCDATKHILEGVGSRRHVLKILTSYTWRNTQNHCINRKIKLLV